MADTPLTAETIRQIVREECRQIVREEIAPMGTLVGELAKDVGILKRAMLQVHDDLRTIKRQMRDGDEWKGGE